MKVEYSIELELDGSRLRGRNEPLVAWIDIETIKVQEPWRRWKPFLVGVAGMSDPGIFFLDVISGTEEEIIEWLDENFENHEMRYAATREFDEMVLRGRFVNARRPHRVEAGPWPNLDKAPMTWKNIRKASLVPDWVRPTDVPSKDVPAAWINGEEKIVVSHCARDVMELFLCDPELDLGKKLRSKIVSLITRG